MFYSILSRQKENDTDKFKEKRSHLIRFITDLRADEKNLQMSSLT